MRFYPKESTWRRWFAWRPVTVSQKQNGAPTYYTAWMEWVERQPTWDPYSIGYDYREASDSDTGVNK